MAYLGEDELRRTKNIWVELYSKYLVELKKGLLDIIRRYPENQSYIPESRQVEDKIRDIYNGIYIVSAFYSNMSFDIPITEEKNDAMIKDNLKIVELLDELYTFIMYSTDYKEVKDVLKLIKGYMNSLPTLEHMGG